jgi:hypothetical protein
MQAIEEYKPELSGVLPQDEYFRLTRSAQNSGLAQRLLKIFSDIPLDAGGDTGSTEQQRWLAKIYRQVFKRGLRGDGPAIFDKCDQPVVSHGMHRA